MSGKDRIKKSTSAKLTLHESLINALIKNVNDLGRALNNQAAVIRAITDKGLVTDDEIKASVDVLIAESKEHYEKLKNAAEQLPKEAAADADAA